MRIWDLNPGYLNRQSLLGEHRELHGIVSILVNKKKGYAKHPETLRWVKHGWALTMRHNLLAAEMSLRGYQDKSPVDLKGNTGTWPPVYIDPPIGQLHILKNKYQDKEPGRIPLPRSGQHMWTHHKYSLLARNPDVYKQIGKEVSLMKPKDDISDLALLLTEWLKKPPTEGGIRNSLQHMWGHVSDFTKTKNNDIDKLSLTGLLLKIQELAKEHQEAYLLSSTALSELMVWIEQSIY